MGALGEMVVPLAVLGVIIALIMPMPPFLLDFLIVVDIMMSVIVLMVSMYIRKPVEFSVFPTLLLLLTVFRLALNVSSSRLILLNGNGGTAAAGHVIEAFGNFVVGGNYIIGAVIFLILIAIQYVVINHGAVRISEVTARFTLDAMPGKQMSIDSDLNAGLIDEADARERRKQLAAEAEFHGAMDGASRFTQRDAVASIQITAINIVAGFLIGVFQHGMDLRRALATYTVLTIGDGLVTVIPALMISVSGALIVTRTSEEEGLSKGVKRQIFGISEPLLLASGVLVLVAAVPGLPTIPFLLLGSGLGAVAWQMRRNSDTIENATAAAPAGPKEKENLEALLRVEPLALEVGLGLIKLVEGGQDSPLLRKITGIRRQLAGDLGYLLPAVRITDNLRLRTHEYVIFIKGSEVARYEIAAGCQLAIAIGRPQQTVEGQPTHDPAFGIPAVWIPSERAEAARAAGYAVVDAVTTMGTHLSELVRRHCWELLSRQETKALVDRVALDHPKLVEDLVPKLLPLSTIQRVLQNLLRERVSIRDAVSILEALGDAGATTRNPVLLSEYVRQSIRRAVVKPYLNKTGELPAYFLDPAIERAVESSVEHGEQNSHLAAAPEMMRDVVARIPRQVGRPEAPAVILPSSGARYFLRQMVESSIANAFFISHNEVPPEVKVISLGTIQ
jgi:flagellar biosynthesis protein FlhA